MSENNDVGIVEIVGREITLFNFDGTKKLNIYNFVQTIDVFESLENYTLQAEIYVQEGIDLLNNFPLGGEEYIEFAIQTPGRKELKYRFFVESIIGATTNEAGLMRSYKLRCCTEDFLVNAFTLFTKRYTGMDYSDAINEVITVDLQSDKSVAIESTKGKFDYVVNSVRPFQVIDLLTERAVSSDNKSSLFFFYEDSDQYNFVTFEKLIKDRKAGVKEKEFYYDVSNKGADNAKAVNARNILSYQINSIGSSVDKVKRGSLRKQVREFDISTGDYFLVQEYNNASDHMQFEKTDGSYDHNSAKYNEFATTMPAVISMTVKDGLRPEMEHNRNLHFKGPFADKLAQNAVNIRVYGDTNMLVGDMIYLSLPEASGATEDRQEQEIYSGNYIIKDLRHHIRLNEQNRFQHFMVMDVRKPNSKDKQVG